MVIKMKKLFICLIAFICIFAHIPTSFADTTDPYSGLLIANGEATLYYMTLFDNACEEYSAELTSDELYAAIDVYDAIGQLSFDDSDASLRQHLLSIKSADDIRLLLTGFFDVNDFTYHEDTATLERVKKILLAAGLNIDDYHLSIVRNRHDLPLVEQNTNSWYCKLGRDTGDEQVPYEEIVIVLCGEDQHVYAMLMNNLFFAQ